MKCSKKILLWMVVFICVSLSALAVDIGTCEELNNTVRLDTGGDYVLTSDLDCSGFNFEPIAGFTGNLDGAGYNVDSLTISKSGTTNVGLFSTTTGATWTIHDIYFTNVNIIAGAVGGTLIGDGIANVARLAIWNVNLSGNIVCDTGAKCSSVAGDLQYASINNVHSTMNVTGTGTVSGLVAQWGRDTDKLTNSSFTGIINNTGATTGGLVAILGEGTAGSTISGCFVDTTIYAESSNVGGIVGSIGTTSYIEDSYAKGTIIAGIGNYVSGTFGYDVDKQLQINNVYSTMNVTGTGVEYGCLRGWNRRNTGGINNSFGACDLISGGLRAGILIGENDGYAQNLLGWNTSNNPDALIGDIDTAPVNVNATTDVTDLYSFSTFPISTWNTNIWDNNCEGIEFPHLIWENYQCGEPTDSTPPTVNLSSPVNTYNETTSNLVTFLCYAEDNVKVENVSLYINGTFNSSVAGVNGTNHTFNINLGNGDYNWTCGATDNNSNSANASEIRTLSVNVSTDSNVTNPVLTSDSCTTSSLFNLSGTFDCESESDGINCSGVWNITTDAVSCTLNAGGTGEYNIENGSNYNVTAEYSCSVSSTHTFNLTIENNGDPIVWNSTDVTCSAGGGGLTAAESNCILYGFSDYPTNDAPCGTVQEVRKMGTPFGIIFFMLAIISALYIVPFKIEQFTQNKVTDFIMKRGCWIIATFLVVMTSAMVATLASEAGIPLTSELFTVMWLFGWGGWIMLIWLGFGTITGTFKMWSELTEQKRAGDADEQ